MKKSSRKSFKREETLSSYYTAEHSIGAIEMADGT